MCIAMDGTQLDNFAASWAVLHWRSSIVGACCLQDALMKEDEEDSDESMDDSESNSDLDSEDDEEEEEEEEEEGEQGSDAGDDVDEVAGQNQVEAWKARYVSMSNPYNDIEEDEDGEGDQLDGQYETRVNDGFEMDAYNEFEEGGEDEGNMTRLYYSTDSTLIQHW